LLQWQGGRSDGAFGMSVALAAHIDALKLERAGLLNFGFYTI
jgi:hypothetical protein